jgi:hypothetical protein
VPLAIKYCSEGIQPNILVDVVVVVGGVGDEVVSVSVGSSKTAVGVKRDMSTDGDQLQSKTKNDMSKGEYAVQDSKLVFSFSEARSVIVK